MPNNTVQALQDLARVRGEQAVGILLVKLQRFRKLAGADERIRVSGNRRIVVMNGE